MNDSLLPPKPDLTYGLSPFVPDASAAAPLRSLAFQLAQESAHLAGRLAPATAHALRDMLAFINSYYSNLIEGEGTHPIEIEAAFEQELEQHRDDRRIQIAVAVVEVERDLTPMIARHPHVSAPDFIRELHRQVYRHLGAEHLDVHNDEGEMLAHMVPGEFRAHDVQVGRHVPYAHEHVPKAMAMFARHYAVDPEEGEMALIRTAAAHHRLAWIHPFLDGNGRVGRLHSHACLIRALNHHPVWSLARGLARAQKQYYAALASADRPRQGNFDGRGVRSQAALVEWCRFFLEAALDQVRYIAEILHVDSFHRRLTKFVELYCGGGVPNFPTLHPQAAPLLLRAFQDGCVERGAVPGITGVGERMGRNIVKSLVEADLLTAKSHRAPLRPRYPIRYAEYLFPDMGPASRH